MLWSLLEDALLKGMRDAGAPNFSLSFCLLFLPCHFHPWWPALESRPAAPSGLLQHFHEMKNCANHSLIADRGVDHRVIDRAARPLDFEIFFDEFRAFQINRIHQFMGLLLIFAAGNQPPYFQFRRGVKKYSQSVFPLPQYELRPSSHDDAVSSARSVPDNGRRILQYTFAVHQV